MNNTLTIVWLRRDLRLSDNAAFYHALKVGNPVLPLFIFDIEILNALEDRHDRRVEFIHQTISALNEELAALGSRLLVRYGKPSEVFEQLSNQLPLKSVFTNHDYEPYATQRDAAVEKLLQSKGIQFQTFKDQALLEREEVMTDAGKPYTVYTPYSRKWKAKITDFHLKSYPTEKYFQHLIRNENYTDFTTIDQLTQPLISLAEMNFQARGLEFPAKIIPENIIRRYAEQRDLPAIQGTTRLSVHVRFGTVSIRQLAQVAHRLSDKWLNELIWRDFYMAILYHFPHVAQQSFKPEYDRIEWRNHPEEFAAWCEGRTGYPLVDAGMRELNTTGFMHNRVRMVVASFLVKHLLIDWRWGERYFAAKLLDYDMSANNGGWQWAAGSGCDAAPYFRVFNPTAQAQKFDPQLQYIKRWIPEINAFSYPKPIVIHEKARQRALEVYAKAVKK